MNLTKNLNAARADLEQLFVTAMKNDPSAVFNLLNKEYGAQNPMKVGSVTGFGSASIVEPGAQIPEDNMLALANLNLDIKVRGKKYTWDRVSQSTDNYNLLRTSGQNAAQRIIEFREKESVDMLLNNAFTTVAGTLANGGGALCQNSHSIAGSTFDNLETAAAMSESTIATMLENLYDQKDARNQPIGYGGDAVILCSNSDRFTARKIIESTQTAGNDQNDKNVIGGLLRVIASPYATSSLAYVMVAAAPMAHSAFYAETIAPETRSDTVAEGHVTFVNQMAYALGVVSPYGIQGNAGS